MKNLIVPIAGKSTRYATTRPKWMLTHPKTSRLMVTSSIEGLNLDAFDNVYFGFLSEHEEHYQFLQGFKQELSDIGILNRSHFCSLHTATRSQSETVYNIIKQMHIDGYVFVKDSDNYFSLDVEFDYNQVCFSMLEQHERINASNKSYISLDDRNLVTGIVEKQVISNSFSVGGYGFTNADDFVKCFETISSRYIDGHECYISHVIFQLILENVMFVGTPVSNYVDWGTLTDWLEYKSHFKTVFCDIDGTLITNTSLQLHPKNGTGQPLLNNIHQLQQLHSSGNTVIVLTTSRPERYRLETIAELSKHNIPFDHLIMSLPHGKRIIVNDYAASNPYPACESINIPRDSDTLYLK